MTVYIKGNSVNILSTIYESLRCFLCCNILENPHQAPCGCRFCFNCINDYLIEDKICPGKSEYCFQQKLNLKKDLKFDVLAKRELNKLIVSCPYNDCNKECELREMKDHIEKCGLLTIVCNECKSGVIKRDFEDHEVNRCAEKTVSCKFCGAIMKRRYIKEEHQNYEHYNLCLKYSDRCPNECGEEHDVIWYDHRRICSNKVVSCPYQVIGCNSINATLTAVSKHIVEQGFHHAEVLLKYIDNVNNEVISFKNEFMLTINKSRDQQLEEVEDQNKRIDVIAAMIDEVNSLHLKDKNPHNNIASQSLVIEEMNNKINKLNNDMESMKKKYESEFLNVIHSLRKSNADLENELTKLKIIVKPIEFRSLIELNDTILVWKIVNFSLINNLFSPTFYTHLMGYKLDLEFRKLVKGFLSIFVRLKAGPYDESLQWPFRKKVTIKILDQDRLNRNYDKVIYFDSKAGPICQRKYFAEQGVYGFNEFISYTELKEKEYLLRNNILWIFSFAEDLNA